MRGGANHVNFATPTHELSFQHWMFGERGCRMPLGAWNEVRGFIACCCAVALRTCFHQPSRMNTPFLIYGVSDTFARDNREHLFSCGRTRMLLATMSLMHAHPAWQLWRAQTCIIWFILIHQQVNCRQVFPASCPVQCESNTLQNLINPLIRINPWLIKFKKLINPLILSILRKRERVLYFY